MKKYKKRYRLKSMYKTRLIALGMAVILVAALFFGYQVLFNDMNKVPSQLKENISSTLEVGEGKILYEQAENLEVIVHYPKIDGKVNKEIYDKAVNLKDNYLIDSDLYTKKTYVYVSYDTTVVSDQYVSVGFNCAIVTDLDVIETTRCYTASYDLTTGEQLDLDQLFEENYLEKIAAIVRKEFRLNPLYQDLLSDSNFYNATSSDKENYDVFMLSDDQIIFTFNEMELFNTKNNTIEISVSVDDISYYLKADYPATELITPSTSMTNTERYIDPTKPMIALTFDDGPSKYTLEIIETLKEYDSAATFYVVGNRVESHSSILKKTYEYGNEIGNHTFTHENLTKLDYDGMMQEIESVNDSVSSIIGETIDTVRPTFGDYNKLLKDSSPYPLILWSVDTQDWRYKNSETGAERLTDILVNNTKDGDIVLMHDLYEKTADATIAAIPQLIEKGFQIVTVSELFEYRGIVLQPGEVYGNAYIK